METSNDSPNFSLSDNAFSVPYLIERCYSSCGKHCLTFVHIYVTDSYYFIIKTVNGKSIDFLILKYYNNA